MKNWEKYVIDFGNTKYGDTLFTTVKYLGNEDLLTKDFSVSCGCTTPEYNKETKTLKVGLNMNIVGTKQSTIQVKGETLILKAEISR